MTFDEFKYMEYLLNRDFDKLSDNEQIELIELTEEYQQSGGKVTHDSSPSKETL